MYANIVLNMHVQGVTNMPIIGKMASTVMTVISGSIEHAQV